ncbi:MAG TPA: Sec-independent protein translocase protein TatB [Chloroflexota bacterium]|jgi:Tat protein translocase TatB subunit|nr:Sec-independent protein translocase protein TatB [Chloroflexota bacterium]HZU07931.1 Sec-independent protein translocase protein TatB [Chloroflexota bacterium]
MDIFGIGAGELFLILVLALIVIGPERLPEVASQLGRTVADLRRQANQLTAEFQRSLELAAQERKEQRLAATVVAPGAVCPSCGARSTREARYCASCGANLVERPADGGSGG